MNELEATVELADVKLSLGAYDECERIADHALALAKHFREDEYNPLQRRPGWRMTAHLLGIKAESRLQQSDHSGAVALLEESVEIRKVGLEYYRQHSDALDFQLDLADGYQRLSVTHLIDRNPAKAVVPAGSAVEIMAWISEQDPDNEQWRTALAGLQTSLGDAMFDSGDVEGSVSHFQAALERYSKRGDEYPDDLRAVRWISICNERLGNVALARGDKVGASEQYQAALALKRKLLEADPNDRTYQHDFHILRTKLEQLGP